LRGEKTIAADRALDAQMMALMARYPDRRLAAVFPKELRVTVDPLLARFSAWYELFPRSLGTEGKHGTFKDCEAALPRIAELGFDILYLPPIHPIGKSFRKGKNNNPKCQPGEPGSPWAIGSSEGGHKSIHPELGSVDDFRRLIEKARGHKIEIAMDIAFQCAPDHPYIKEHPDWFLKRPDGSIQYAENPPKKYEDIVPFNFECDDWRGLWGELKSVFEFWIQQGIRVFRVDNPHTKPFAFWEWCISGLKRKNPDLIFLSEAFTRPRVMYRLAKLGFTQSYNYFPWRNTKTELTDYLTEITRPPVSDFLRYNLWPNTPDILTQFLQSGGREAFMIRLVLAATLGASYGIYGPAFELCENAPREPDTEEYLNSEKYEIRQWDLNTPQNLAGLITRLNKIRRENPALQSDTGLRFHRTDNDQLLAYTKMTPDKSDILLIVVNLNPNYTHSGWLELPLDEFEMDTGRTFQMHDLLTDTRFFWHGSRNYVELNPRRLPAHVLRLRRYTRTEHDFDYFL
jgi:starch synthase (maltosyl-transferring)